MGGVVGDPEGPGDDGGHPRQGPEVGAEPVGRRPVEEQLQEPRPLPRGQAGWPPGGWLRAERVGAAGRHVGLPATDGGRGTADLPGDRADS